MVGIKEWIAELSTHENLDQRLMHFANRFNELDIDDKWTAVDLFMKINELKSN